VHDLERDFTVQLINLALIVIVSVISAFAVRHRRPWALGLDPVASCLALGSLLAILVSTVSRRGDGRAAGGVQLVPLRTLRSYHYDLSDLVIYLIGNVALFVPLGFFLFLALRRGLIVTTAVCALISVGVEILQLPIWTRSSDVDDVLTNTTGGLLGALAGLIVLSLYRAVRTSGHGPIRHYAEGSQAS
jgi:hypothetical protein